MELLKVLFKLPLTCLNNKKLAANTTKSQGEIFGVMIFFVLLILGFYFYSQYQAVYSVEEQDSVFKAETEILVNSVMEQVKRTEIECFTNRGFSGVDLLQSCVDNTGSAFSEYNISCTNPVHTIEVCEAFTNMINTSLYEFFNGTNGNPAIHSSRPFYLQIIPSSEIRYSHLNKSFDNLEANNLSLNTSSDNYYLRKGYSRISVDLQNIPTNQGKFEFELSFFR